MSRTIQKTLMISGVSALAFAILPLSGSFNASGLSSVGVSAALARDGNSGSGNSGGGNSGGDSGSDDHGGRSGGDDNSSGSRHGGRDDSNDDSSHRGRDHAEDDNSTDDNSVDRRGRGRGRGGDDALRSEVALSVSDASLQGLLNGSLVAIDDLGRRLEVEVELEHGVRTVFVKPHRSSVHTTPGPITSVSVVPVTQ
ncbi:hypothetical protein [Pararhizobium sp.]|uniref:hypothetical protein n=1 Tax=Pararhizobium sp. TaxID=1977563 RepID=UPI00271ECDAB|nr:hypothetical protein [Pararhizobium sp.]MDO9416431.1 hypothetical protein [Pararhizobium sp.]